VRITLRYNRNTHPSNGKYKESRLPSPVKVAVVSVVIWFKLKSLFMSRLNGVKINSTVTVPVLIRRWITTKRNVTEALICAVRVAGWTGCM
jgi:hypothetical protein